MDGENLATENILCTEYLNIFFGFSVLQVRWESSWDDFSGEMRIRCRWVYDEDENRKSGL